MSNESTEAFATRLPAELAGPLLEAVQETGATKSDLLRLAVADYVRRNPHGFHALAKVGWVDQMLAEMEKSDG